MHLRRIKVLAIGLSSVGLVALETVRHYVLHPLTKPDTSHVQEHFISGAILFVGVIVFSLAIFRLLERLHGQLVAVSEAAIAVTADLSVDRVLERVAELARSVAGVPYASVRVWGEPGKTLASGDRPEESWTLVLPIVVKGERLGELALASPRGRHLRASDRRALETFATQAGIALENARLFEQVQELVASRERVRIGMDLHDGVIQELYAVGLKVEDAAELVGPDPAEAAALMRDVEERLRGAIEDLRSYVHGLRGAERPVGLRTALERLVAEFPSGPPTVTLARVDHVQLGGVTAGHLVHIVREALSNALRHASASRVAIRAVADGGTLTVSVEDDGVGFDPAAPSAGLGLRHMRERAAWCGCELSIDSAPGRGTVVRVCVPGSVIEPVPKAVVGEESA